MSSSKLYRLSGLGLAIGAVVFTVHLVLRSFATAGMDAASLARQGSWVAINALGFLGATLTLLGLPGLYARFAAETGRLGLAGFLLLFPAWTFFGIFLSLYAALLQPWLAAEAPALLSAEAGLPAGILVAFAAALLAWLVGNVLLGIPLVRGRPGPRWAGYAFIASGIWMVLGNLVIAPSGPASNLALNLLSNLGPVLFLIPSGYLGALLWAERPPREG